MLFSFIRNYSLFLVTDSPTTSISRKTKPNGIDDHQHTKSCQNMKSIISPKHTLMDFSDLERNNIYAETPPKVKSTTLINNKNHYAATRSQQRPPIPFRTDSTRSVGSTTTSSLSSQSTTPSNSFRQDPRTIMSRSTDVSSSEMKTSTNTMKSKYDIETAILNNNNRCLSMISNGYSAPLQSVKEDECLEVDNNNNEKYSKVNRLERNFQFND